MVKKYIDCREEKTIHFPQITSHNNEVPRKDIHFVDIKYYARKRRIVCLKENNKGA